MELRTERNQLAFYFHFSMSRTHNENDRFSQQELHVHRDPEIDKNIQYSFQSNSREDRTGYWSKNCNFILTSKNINNIFSYCLTKNGEGARVTCTSSISACSCSGTTGSICVDAFGFMWKTVDTGRNMVMPSIGWECLRIT